MTYELKPINGQKSFYGKANVIVGKGIEFLRSYETIVAVRKAGKLYRTVWYAENPNCYCQDLNNWSATTGKHIKAFCGLNKAAYLALPIYKGAKA